MYVSERKKENYPGLFTFRISMPKTAFSGPSSSSSLSRPRCSRPPRPSINKIKSQVVEYQYSHQRFLFRSLSPSHFLRHPIPSHPFPSLLLSAHLSLPQTPSPFSQYVFLAMISVFWQGTTKSGRACCIVGHSRDRGEAVRWLRLRFLFVTKYSHLWLRRAWMDWDA